MAFDVPFLNLRASYLACKDKLIEATESVLDSGSYILGNEVEKFEVSWAKYCGSDYAIGVGNGLDALRIGLLAINIQEGDEVIVPAHTFIASWLAVTSVGAIPKPVDVISSTYNINTSKIESEISPKTKAIMPVHLYGKPCNINKIKDIAKRYNLRVIEDAAQAHGAIFDGKKIGCHGDVVCWSFYPGKNLGAFGDAGAVTTNDSMIAHRLKSLRNYGSHKKYIHSLKGINSRLDPLQAAFLSVKLKFLDEWNDRRRLIADAYSNSISRSEMIKLPINSDGKNIDAWHLYVIQHKKRDELQKYLKNCSIETLIHYPIPPFKQDAFAEYNTIEMPVTSELSSKILSLPLCPFMTDNQVDRVINSLENFSRLKQ